MPATLPPWLRASNAPSIYAAAMPEGFKLGMQSDQFGREMALKGAEAQTQAVKSGAEIGLQAGSQANAMAMNIANLRWQQEKQAQDMELAWQKEANDIAQRQAALDEAAYRSEMDHSIKQQQLQQEAMMNAHKLAVEREYRNATIGLSREQLKEKQLEFDVKTQEAAQKSQAMIQYQKELATAPDEQSKLEVARKWFPVIGATPTAATSLFKQSVAPEPVQTQDIPLPDGRHATAVITTNPRTGARTTHVINPQRTTLNAIESQQMKDTVAEQREAKNAYKDLVSRPTEGLKKDALKQRQDAIAAAKKKLDELDNELAGYQKKLQPEEPSPFAEGTIVQLKDDPTKKFRIVKGKPVPIN